MGRLFGSLLAVIFVAEAMLLGGGLLVDHVRWEHGYGWSCSFFAYRIGHYDAVPFWFLASLFLVGLNGYWLLRLARYVGRTEFSPFRQDGKVSWDVPIQYGILFGRNLLVVCAILLAFVFLHGHRL